MTNSPSFGALAGLRVLDLSRTLGGPYCTQILGDHGAEIFKIEPPQGDETRDWGPPFYEGEASYYLGINRNKRSIGLDLSKGEGHDVMLRLLKQVDVLVENFKPGTMERWGLGYETVLAQRFPRLIHLRVSGFGEDGPLGGFPGYDAVVQAMAGMFSVNGDVDSGPTRIGIPLVDLGTGLYSAIAILMAVIERNRSGRGQFIDMTLHDSAIALMHPHLPNYFVSERVPGLTGNAHPNLSPYDKFKTRTTDIFLAIGNNRAFQRLCRELGRPELAEDPRFKENADRSLNREQLTEVLESLLAEVDGFEFCDRMLATGVVAGPIMDTEGAMKHPHTAHRQMVVTLDWYRGAATPIKFSRTPGAVLHTPPAYGVHGREVLREFGFDEETIRRLIEKGVLLESRRSSS